MLSKHSPICRTLPLQNEELCQADLLIYILAATLADVIQPDVLPLQLEKRHQELFQHIKGN